MQQFLSLLLGPMFAKEMVEIARRKRYFFNRVFYGSVLLFALFVTWDAYSYQFRRGSPSIQDMAMMASALFTTVAWVQYCAVYLFVPVFVCGVISSERELRTLDLLLTTQLSDREIVLGKLGSRLAVTALLIGCALPIISLIMLFGGVDPGAVFRTQMATLLAMVYSGAHAIYFSSISKSPIGAMVRTYWWMAVWLLGLPCMAGLLIGITNAGPNSSIAYFLWAQAFINPITPFLAGAIPEFHIQIARHVGIWYLPFTYLVPLAWTGFLMWRAVLRLRLPPTLLVRVGNRFRWFRALRDEWRKFASFKLSIRRIFAPLAGGVFPVRNALWLRARQANVYDREGHIGRIQWAGVAVAVTFLTIILFGEPRALGEEEVAMSFLSPTWIAVAALAVIISASGLVSDRRRGFFELVLATRLRPQEIVGGTLLAVCHHLRVSFCLAWGLTLFFIMTGASHPVGAIMSAITGTLFCATILMMGTMCSLTARTVPAALVPTFAYPIVMCVGIMFLMLAEEASGPLLWVIAVAFLIGTGWWSRRSTSAAAIGCRFIAVHLALACAASFWTWNGGSREEYPIAMMHPAFLTIVLLDDNFGSEIRHLDAWPLAVLLYWTAMVVNLIWARQWMIRQFDRLVGRTLKGPDLRHAPLALSVSTPPMPGLLEPEVDDVPA